MTDPPPESLWTFRAASIRVRLSDW